MTWADLQPLWADVGGTWETIEGATADPDSLSLLQVADDVVVTWSAPTMPSATHVGVFRRSGIDTTTPFDPTVETPLALISVGTLEYTDVSPGSGNYVYQVIPVKKAT
jgi:hypothetical protein